MNINKTIFIQIEVFNIFKFIQVNLSAMCTNNLHKNYILINMKNKTYLNNILKIV